MVQDELWATVARPKRLTVVVDRLYELGDDVASVTATQAPSKGTRGTWTHCATYRGPDYRIVVDAELARLWALHTGPRWEHKPAALTYEAWIAHLTMF
jgi:hypothetical protein